MVFFPASLIGQCGASKTRTNSQPALYQDELKIPLEMSTIPTPKEFKAGVRDLRGRLFLGKGQGGRVGWEQDLDI